MVEQSVDVSGLIAQIEARAAQQEQASLAELHRSVAVLPAPQQQSPQVALPFPPGFVGELARFVFNAAPRPVAEVAVVGALGLMAGICGKAWHIPGSGLNLYVVLVARSAIGKEAMHQGIMKVVRAAIGPYPQFENFVDPSDFASGPALIKACSQNSSFVNLAGEIGHKFLEMADAKSGSPARMFRKVLTTLYSKSGPDDVAGGITYSNQENNVQAVQAVAFSLIGETTPGTFYQSITDSMMQDGFMSRFCVIEYRGDRPAKNVAPLQRPSESLLQHIVAIARQADFLISSLQFQQVSFSDGGRALLDRFEEECDAAIIAAGDDENQRAVWNRANLNALRVAALLAVGDNPMFPSVSEEHAAWAITLIRHGTAAFQKRIREGDIGAGTDGGREQKVLELCREFLTLPADKLPAWLKEGAAMQQAGIVPRKYLQQRTLRIAAFEKHNMGHVATLNMAIKTAMTNGNLMEVKKDRLVEMFGFHGQAYRVLSLA